MSKVTAEDIKKLDKQDVYGSTKLFTKQCLEIHALLEKQSFTIDASKVKNIVFSGMGGSSYGGHVATSLLRNHLDVPVYTNNDYTLPRFVSKDSLVVVTSYSGTTEETVASLEDAKQKNAQIISLSSGGELSELAKKGKCDTIVFETKSNPSGQPRLGTGYIVLGTLEILRKTELSDITKEDVEKAISEAEENQVQIEAKSKHLAEQLEGFIPFIFAGEHLVGNAHIMRNQFNETSKSFSSFHPLPEADHHLLEGLSNPQDSNLAGLFLESNLYAPKIAKRFTLTKEVVEKNNKAAFSYKLFGTTRLSQVLELLMLGSFVTFYLGIAYKQDPSLIPWVDYFKEQLKK